MKTGILSMQRIYNYGSWLQAYALKKMVEQYSKTSVEFVDYHVEKPVYIKGGKKLQYYSGCVRKELVEIITDSKLLTRILPVDELKHIYKYKHIYQPFLFEKTEKKMNYNPILDVLVIGSDEVFNCLQANVRVGYSPELFGCRSRAKKTLSYAASFGNTTYDKIKSYGVEAEIAKYLTNLKTISVRDENSYDIVYRLTGIIPEIHLDPVLIYDFSNENIKTEVPSEPYMIVYTYRNRLTPTEKNTIMNFAKKNELKIYCIGADYSFADRVVYDFPLNILQYFKEASCIVTDTFHGTIFSIINHKVFTTIIRSSGKVGYGNEEKLRDLLIRLDLKDRILTDINNLGSILYKSIDYKNTEQIIANERERTKAYITKEVSATDE